MLGSAPGHREEQGWAWAEGSQAGCFQEKGQGWLTRKGG